MATACNAHPKALPEVTLRARPVQGVPRSPGQAGTSAMWKPEPAVLQQLAALLERTQQPSANQKELLDQLQAHRGNADFNSYLAHIFAYAPECSELVRGLLDWRGCSGHWRRIPACTGASPAHVRPHFGRQGLCETVKSITARLEMYSTVQI
jgi:hypothetical protein